MSHAMMKGALPNNLANEVSDAIYKALKSGMETDEAVCVVIAVAADYARGAYGDGYLPELAKVITSRPAHAPAAKE